MADYETLLVTEETEGERLDSFVSDSLDNLSRSTVQNLIKTDRVQVNNKAVKASYRVQNGDQIQVEIPRPQIFKLEPQNIELAIIYQDEDLVVVDKPKGMVVHPAHGNWEGTLVNALLYHVKTLSNINAEMRPGIVHRLDKDTSGVMVVAKNDQAHHSLAEQIRAHSVKREYIALVHGVIKEKFGRIDAPIGRSTVDRKKMAVIKEGREAVSDYEVLQRYPNYTLVKVDLLTGRTHQIRVHFAYIKHAVVGDPLYSAAKRRHFDLDTQALHACLLGFNHPRSGEYLEFTSHLPPYLQNILAQLGGGKPA